MYISSASGAYCVEEFAAPFCPTAANPDGDERCCLDRMYAAAATSTEKPPRNRPRPLVRLRAKRRKGQDTELADEVLV